MSELSRKEAMTMGDVERYIAKLEPEWQNLYRKVSEYVRDAADTLSEEFQLAASIEDVFHAHCRDQL
jgi:hypothetical protein